MTLTASDIVANAHDATAGIIPLQLSPYGCHQFYIGHHNSEWHSAEFLFAICIDTIH